MGYTLTYLQKELFMAKENENFHEIGRYRAGKIAGKSISFKIESFKGEVVLRTYGRKQFNSCPHDIIVFSSDKEMANPALKFDSDANCIIINRDTLQKKEIWSLEILVPECYELRNLKVSLEGAGSFLNVDVPILEIDIINSGRGAVKFLESIEPNIFCYKSKSSGNFDIKGLNAHDYLFIHLLSSGSFFSQKKVSGPKRTILCLSSGVFEDS